MNLLPPTAILFDWDNTLVDSGAVIFRALNATLVAMGHEPWTPSDARLNFLGSCREAMPTYFGHRAGEAEAIFYQNILEHHLDLTPLDGSKVLLEHVHELGIPMGIVSNKRSDILRREVAGLGWDHWFQVIVGAGEAERDKPAPDPIILALKGISMAPSSNVWMVGDSPVDWTCAKAAGCSAIKVGSSSLVKEKVNDTGEGETILENHLHNEPVDPTYEIYDLDVANCHHLKKILSSKDSLLGLWEKLV